MIKQVSVFMQNQEGHLKKVLKIFFDNNINIRSLTIAETENYGIMRLILENTDRAIKILKENHIMANVTEVLAAEIFDTPGALYHLVNKLSEKSINIEYAYSFLPKHTTNALVIFKVAENTILEAKDLLEKSHAINLLDSDELLTK